MHLDSFQVLFFAARMTRAALYLLLIVFYV